MEILFALTVGVMVAGGVYLVLRAWSFAVVLGYTLIGYAVNLLLFAAGGLTPDRVPIVTAGAREYPDPLPQDLGRTALVIGFGMTAYAIVLALKANGELETDRVDGEGDG